VLFGVSLLVFAVMHLAPGDPAAIMLGAQATREDITRLHRELGLDRPLPVQYARWLGRVVQGDLGRSIPLGREVLPEVLTRFKASSPAAPSSSRSSSACRPASSRPPGNTRGSTASAWGSRSPA
jgi:peptide/nickel transport system permease protein